MFAIEKVSDLLTYAFSMASELNWPLLTTRSFKTLKPLELVSSHPTFTSMLVQKNHTLLFLFQNSVSAFN